MQYFSLLSIPVLFMSFKEETWSQREKLYSITKFNTKESEEVEFNQT